MKPDWPVRVASLPLWMALLLPAAAAAADAWVVRIGHAAPTSGWLATVGIENENSARLAVETLNARPLQLQGRPLRFELRTADDAGEPSRASDVARALLDAGAAAVVGHLLSSSTLAAAPVYAAAGVAQVSPSASIGAYTRSGWPTALRLVADDVHIAERLAREAVERLGARRFVLIDDRSAWGHALAGDFAQSLQRAGGQVLRRLQVDETATDLRATVAEAKALAPDALFFGGYDRQAGLLLMQMQRQGLAARFVSGDAPCTLDLVSFWAAGAAHDDQVLCALPAGIDADASPALRQFAADYARRYGRTPEFYGAHAYDAVMLIGDAVLRAGSAEPAAILRALRQTRDFAGASGAIGFAADGDLLAPAVDLYTYRGEQRVLLRTLR